MIDGWDNMIMSNFCVHSKEDSMWIDSIQIQYVNEDKECTVRTYVWIIFSNSFIPWNAWSYNTMWCSILSHTYYKNIYICKQLIILSSYINCYRYDHVHGWHVIGVMWLGIMWWSVPVTEVDSKAWLRSLNFDLKLWESYGQYHHYCDMPNKSCLVIISSSKLNPLLVFDIVSVSYVSLQDLACISTYHLSAISLSNFFSFLIYHSASPLATQFIKISELSLITHWHCQWPAACIWYSELDLFIFCHTHLWPPHIFRSPSTLSLPTYITTTCCLYLIQQQ